jgi:hypothetical protein
MFEAASQERYCPPQVKCGCRALFIMFLQHYGLLITGILLVLASLAASYVVWNTPRSYGSPRWPLLAFCFGIALKGFCCCLQFSHHGGLTILSPLSTGILWFSLGAVGTQWFHENIQLRRSVQR